MLVRCIGASFSPVCPYCGSKELTRLVSSFAYHRSFESGDSDNQGPDYYKDPRNIGRWTEKRFREMGTEMPPEIRETIQASREGEMPSAVKDLQPNVTEI